MLGVMFLVKYALSASFPAWLWTLGIFSSLLRAFLMIKKSQADEDYKKRMLDALELQAEKPCCWRPDGKT